MSNKLDARGRDWLYPLPKDTRVEPRIGAGIAPPVGKVDLSTAEVLEVRKRAKLGMPVGRLASTYKVPSSLILRALGESR